MIGSIAPYVAKIRRSYQSNDIVDRLNYQYTTLMVMLAAITLAATQYVGKPIQCWVPAQFTGAWEKYAETYCFMKGSYFLPLDEQIDQEYAAREGDNFVGYYQWVPLVLAFQAFLFYFPSLVWKAFNFCTGINVKSVLNSAALVKKKFNRESRTSQVVKAAEHLSEALEMQRELKTQTYFWVTLGKKKGLYLSVLYLATKLMYVANVLIQFVILNAFLGPQYTFWGFGILSDLWDGREWNESGHFPRVTMCDFNVRVLGNIHRWTVQCVLMINMFNEKIFVFFWFWFLLVGVLSVLSFCYWFCALLIQSSQRGFVDKYLRCCDIKLDHNQLYAFANSYLRTDGVFLLRLIQTNGGDLLTGELTVAIYRHYCEKRSATAPSRAITESPDSRS
ncbi:hypothetical protein QR680_017430 [Steinernema hermaphroditum]|uniref:Innexin n=1 Tax=Steinernema hermaphroditum TaxID=289476 RepID=A0AA39HEI1_9BILA|nr:hypothetical protein QR680_017430 [Steinernema hermaphroditum]